MSTIPLTIYLEVPFFELEEISKALECVSREEGVLYTYKTSGLCNWLDRGPSNVDSLGLVILPRGLPERIDMPDDPPDTR